MEAGFNFKPTADEVKKLQNCINNLTGIQGLAAVWSGQASSQIVGAFLEVLVRILRLDFAYARTIVSTDGLPIEAVRFFRHQTPNFQAQQVGRALEKWLGSEPLNRALSVANPFGEGTFSIISLRLGLQEEIGLVAAGSRRPDFPTQIEMLLLRVAADQAVIGLQESRRREEQKRAAQELERRVAERTEQLTIVNEELKKEMTERERAQAEESKLAALVENSTDFIGIASLEGEALFVNAVGQKMVGLEGDEHVRATSVLDHVFEEERERFQQQIIPTLMREGQWEGEVRFRHFKTGAAIPMLQHLFFIKEPESGRRLALATISRDITMRKRAEEELLALKDELTAELTAMTRLHELSTRLLTHTELKPLLEEVLDATIAMLNADFGNIQLYNPQTQALEIVAQRGFHQEFLDYFNRVHEGMASCGVALQRGERVVVEDIEADPSFAPHLHILAAAGYRAVQSTPLFSRSGERLGMISTHFRQRHRPSERELRLADLYARQAAEMIERKQAEEALRRSEERFRLLVEGARDYALFMLDPDGRVMTWNKGAERIQGYRTVEILGRHFSVFYEPSEIHLSKSGEGLRVAEATGRFEDEGWRIRKDGSRFWADVIITALKDETGKLQAFVKITRDMTERKRAEEALQQAFEEIKMLKDQLAQEKLYLEEEIRAEQGFEEVIGQSVALKHILKQVETVAPIDSTVLIQGETGTGKELIARAIHNRSKRRERTFVKINCAAIPTGLLESELFGHEKGAFTGAIAQRIGRFELANQGTIFLDEVGEIPFELQAKLLRVLQEQEFERLGSTKTIRVDVRLIAASNRDLAQMVAQREFRSDLYYRLKVFPITAPALRDRVEDIPLLVRYFTERYTRQFNKPITSIPSEIMTALCLYPWPGNVRELENFIERSVILSPGTTLDAPLGELRPGDDGAAAEVKLTTLEEVEREHILRALNECNWVIAGPSGAAGKLGMKRTSLQYKMQKLGITRPLRVPALRQR